MPSYFVESYASDSGVDEARARARLAGDLGPGIRYVRTTFLPGDETIFHMFEAPSLEALRDAGHRAALHYQRIVEAVEGSTDPSEEER